MPAPNQAPNNLIVVISPEERVYVNSLRLCLASAGAVKAVPDATTSPAMLATVAKQTGVSGVLVASDSFFRQLVDDPAAKRGNYEGSMFTKHGVEFVILPTLLQLQAGGNRKRFLAEQYISKLTRRDQWMKFPEFSWTICTDENAEELLADFATADYLGCDIETRREGLAITMMGFTATWITDGKVRMHTAVIPVGKPDLNRNATLWIDKFCQLEGEKIFQGGRYDIAYLARWGISVHNWRWDTMMLMHSWYAEQPKDLATLSAFFLRDSEYWKDLGKSGDFYTKMLYNALDCYRMSCVFFSMMAKMPSWAKVNYAKKFPMIFPAHMCEMRGIEVDIAVYREEKKNQEQLLEEAKSLLCRSVGNPSFNANSPKQVKQLLTILGCDVEDTNESTLEALAYKNRFVGHFVQMILDIRSRVKLIGTYLNEEKLFKREKDGVTRYYWLYSLLPYGTETGRNASEESAFWCGQNLQNIPAGKAIKQCLVPPPGFKLVECDSEQAESRDTAHIAGEVSLIAAVSGTRDFHSVNCSAFFGVPYEEIFDDAARKVINKMLRSLAKRVNHGANYCMGASVLVKTMGLANIDYARRALNLPKQWGYKEVAEHLLAQFHRTYPGIAGTYYRLAVQKVKQSRMLTGATGWTRYFFGDMDNKREFNAAMAHSPQSLNAMRLDEAFLKVFVDLAMHPVHSKNFKLFMQIHDSIFFAIRQGHEYLIQEVVNRMQIPITITGYDGVTRTYVVPAAAKAGKDGTGANRWSETE